MSVHTVGRGAVPGADMLADVLRLAGLLATSSMVPLDDAGKPENVVVAVLWDREVGHQRLPLHRGDNGGARWADVAALVKCCAQEASPPFPPT